MQVDWASALLVAKDGSQSALKIESLVMYKQNSIYSWRKFSDQSLFTYGIHAVYPPLKQVATLSPTESFWSLCSMEATSGRTCGQQRGGNGWSSDRPSIPLSGSVNKVRSLVAICKVWQVDCNIRPLSETLFFTKQWRPLKAVNPYMQCRCGAEAAAVMAKIRNVENMDVRFFSCGAVTERHAEVLWNFFLLHGASRATATWLSQWKVGMVCIPTKKIYIGLVSTATEDSKVPATIMRDNYKRVNSSCNVVWGGDRPLVQIFVK